jgi:RsiW-degrading membrane proteinase PrsW (M82 family)
LSADDSVLAVRVTAAVLCAFGAAVLGWHFFRFLLVFPGPATVAVALELPLLLFGFWLLRLLRPVRAPVRAWSAAAVMWGATAATGCALLANQGLVGLWAKGAGIRFASNWSASLSAPLNEEIFKLCGVAMVVLAAPLVITGPLDGLIYGALAGLGFQLAENVTYGLNTIVQSGATDAVRAVTNSMLVRVGTTALGSHWTMTAVAGAGIGYLVLRGRQGALPALACLGTAMAMHLVFDAPHPPIPVKVTLNFVVVAALYVLLSSAYLSRARAVVASQAAAGIISPGEATAMLSRRHRRRALRRAMPGAERDGLLAVQQEILTRLDRHAA